jgi:hypothetical protein
MILSKTLAKDIVYMMRINLEKVRAERNKEHLHKVVIYY